jgi:hypothetical protein
MTTTHIDQIFYSHAPLAHLDQGSLRSTTGECKPGAARQ